MLTEKQKILLFYALEALERTMGVDDDGDIYFRQSDYSPLTSEIARLGDEQSIRLLIENTLDTLC